MKLNTSRAIIKIIGVEKISNNKDKKAYKAIATYKEAMAVATKHGDANLSALYKMEIQQNRGKLREFREQTYTFNVYLKKYKRSADVTAVYMPIGNLRDAYKDLIRIATERAIKQIRNEMKLLTKIKRVGSLMFNTIGSKAKGFVFIEEGSILKAHIQKNAKIIYDSKTPSLPKKYIGIELEFCAPIKEEQLVSKLFQSGIHKFAQLKQDGSLRPKEKEFGYELAILLEENNYKKGLKKVIDVLTSIKAISKDRRCGFHVHLDMRRRNKDLVYNNLVACQYALLSIVDPTRYNNEFCRIVDTRRFPTEFTGDRQERYKTINAAAYYKYRTLEVRMHEGSTDYTEITHWIDLLVKLSNYSKKMKQNVTKLSTLQQRLKLKKNLYNYALERSCSWQVQNNDHTQEMRNDINHLSRPRIRPLLDFDIRNMRPVPISSGAEIPPVSTGWEQNASDVPASSPEPNPYAGSVTVESVNHGMGVMVSHLRPWSYEITSEAQERVDSAEQNMDNEEVN